VRLREAERGDDAIRQTIEFMRTGGQLVPDSVQTYPPGSWRAEGEGEAYFPLSPEVRVTVFWERPAANTLEVHVQGEWWWRPYPGRRQRHYTPDLSVDVPMDDLARLSWHHPRPWLRPEVQSLIYELLTEVLPRWRGSHGEPLQPPARSNPDLPLRELYRELLRDSTNRTRWLELINAANRAGMGVRFHDARSLITDVEEDGTLVFDGQILGFMRMMFNIRSPSLITGGLEFVPLTGAPPVTPPVQPNMDERMRELERRAGAGDQEAKLQLLHAQFRARPWLETWLAWKLEEANQQVWAKNAKWSPDCEPCGEVNSDGVRYALDSAIKVRSAIVRRDGHPTKAGYARQKVRKRYEGARTVVVGAKLVGSDGTWAFVVRPYLRRHPTQYGLNLEDVLPGLPHQSVEPLTSAARYADTGWFQYIQSQPDHYLATPKEVELFVAPVGMQHWTEGPGAEHSADVCNRCGTRTTHIDAGFCPSLHGMGCLCGGAWIPSFDEPAQLNPVRRRLTYGQLPSREEFDAAFEEEAPAGYRVRLSSRDYDALEWAGLYHYAPRDRWDEDETWEILNALVAAWRRGDDDPYGADYAGDLASSIMTTLGFEWV